MIELTTDKWELYEEFKDISELEYPDGISKVIFDNCDGRYKFLIETTDGKTIYTSKVCFRAKYNFGFNSNTEILNKFYKIGDIVVVNNCSICEISLISSTCLHSRVSVYWVNNEIRMDKDDSTSLYAISSIRPAWNNEIKILNDKSTDL